MKKIPAITGWAICAALITALLTSSLVFAEGNSPDQSVDDPSAASEETQAADDPTSIEETPVASEQVQETATSSDETTVPTEEATPTPSDETATAEETTPSSIEETTEVVEATPTPVPTASPDAAPIATEEADDSTTSDDDPVETPAADEAIVAETPTAEPTTDPTADPTLDEESSETDESTILVVDEEDGSVVGTDSQNTSASGSDPWWISGGIKYAVVTDAGSCPADTTYGSTCYVDSSPITYALSLIDTNGWVPADGKLYVEAGDYSDNVVIDGSSGNGYLSSLKGLIGAGSSTVSLTGSISISNTTLGFTLSGFNVVGSISLDNNSGSLYLDDLYVQNDSGDGLTVSNQNGNVTVTNVQSRGNKGDGARIDNSAATKSSVSISNSSFDYNDDGNDLTWNVGLYINTNGPVTLDGVTASNNNGNGADIYNFSALTIKNSLFDHNFVDPYASNYGYGLRASTANAATVRIENVFAYYNDNTAIDLETAGSVYLSYVRASHTSIRVGEIDASGETVNERLNEDNKYTGDRWYFSGTNGQDLDILLESDFFDAYLELYDSNDTLLASNDNIDGTTTNAQINYTLLADGDYYIVVKTLESSGSSDGDYTLSVNDSSHTNETDYNVPGMIVNTASGYGTITISSGMFQHNVGDGIQLDSKRTISLTTVDASYNSHNGAVIDTCQYDDLLGYCTGSGQVKINSPYKAGWYGANYFLGNSGTGLLIRPGSSILIYNTSAYDNLGNGLEIDNPYIKSSTTIRVSLDNFSNVYRNNGGSGIKINTAGSIVIYDTQADLNEENGFQLSAVYGISLYNVSASENGGDGLLVENADNTGKVALYNKTNGSQGEYNNNGGNGIVITSLGSIYIYNVMVNENGASGAWLDTCVLDGEECLGKGSVIIGTYYTQQNTFDSNTDYGLYITTGGSVSLMYVSASENDDTGIFIDNPYTYGTVTIKNPIRSGSGEYSYNGGAGINISTRGNIALYNIDTSSNSDNGLTIDNCQQSGEECLGTGKVILKGLYRQSNSFSDNHGYGLHILSGGSIYLADIIANQNGYDGLYINNSIELAIQGVTIGSSKGLTNEFNYNGANLQGTYPGIEILTYGNIYLISVEANNNYAAGAYLKNDEATISASYIRILDGNFNENQGSGLLAYSKGKVYLYGVSASSNSLLTSDIVSTGETVYERLTTNTTYDTWWFEATAGTHVNIILESLEFDAYLELYDADGNLIASDDNTYSDYDAQIEMDLPSDSTYYIRVMAADANHGNYTISINDELHDYKTYFNFYGALIDNSAGSDGVYITKGKSNFYNEFEDNNYRGIELDTNNFITAFNVSAPDNGDTGAYFSNADGKGNITIRALGKGEVGNFDSNSEWGLFAASSGSIYVTNISASANGSAGAFLNNCIASGGYCLGDGNVYVRSSAAVNEFNSNTLYGLYVASSGHVYLYDIQADANGYDGLYVKNQYSEVFGNVTLRSAKNNTNSFSGNGWKNPLNMYGLEIYSNGTVSLYAGNVIANYGGGGLISNDVSGLVRNVYLNDSNFEANQGNGLWVNSDGSIYLNGVQSRYNSVNSGSIDLLGETVFEHLTPYYESDTWWFDGYTDDPVDIILESDEFDVLLQVFDQDGNLIATDDDSYGGTDAQLTFTLPANGNYYIRVSASDGGDGNYTLSLNDEAMEYPTLYRFSGAHLDNDGGSGNILITTSAFNSEPSFYHNNYDGLEILTAGSVTMYSLSAMQNGEDGVNIDATAGTGSILIKSTSRRTTSSFSYNTKFGLYIESSGNVSVINNGRMFLRDNGYSGAYINNASAESAYVIFYKAEVNQNTLKGLEINSSGNVTINNILAVNNGSNGVYVDNTFGIGYVKLLGSMGENNISDNNASGLAIYSNNSITVDRVIAIQNGGNGMIFNNEDGSGAINVTNVVSRLNARDGLQIKSGGPSVLLKNIQSMSNGVGYDGDGLYIEIPDPSYLKIYYSTFIGNEGNGIDILGAVPSYPQLYSVWYFGNDTDMDGDPNMQVLY